MREVRLLIKAAGVVLYEPNIQRLNMLLSSLVTQSDVVFIIDNSKQELDFDLIENINWSKIRYEKNHYNHGLAKALSVLCENARINGITWLLLLDQDSIISDNFYKKYIENIHLDNVALICPTIIEDRFNLKQSHRIVKEIEKDSIYEVESAITSGSYIDLNVQARLGFFEELFVDGVDNDYSYRIRAAGFRILHIKDNYIYHEFGNSELTVFSHIYKFITGKLHPSFIRRNHSVKRIYYQIRNTVILRRKWRSNASLSLDTSILKSIVSFSLKIILVEKKKITKILMVIRGLIDGFTYFIEGEN